MKRLLALSILLFASTLFAATRDEKLVLHEEDKDLVLHSDGAGWGFKPAKDADGKLPKVLLIGDSIMNGYRWTVAQKLKGKATVDVWMTGRTLKDPDIHADLKKVLAQGPYDVIHFNLGLHGLGGVPNVEYEPLLEKFVDIMRDNSKGAKLIWASLTPTAVTNKPKQPPMKLNPRKDKQIKARNIIAARVMKKHRITVNDLYTLMSGDNLQLIRDGVHWTGEGKGLMAKQVLMTINEAMTKPSIVKDGKANAEIVVSKDAPRMARLAALELQYYLKKMSGAEVPIVFEKNDADNIKIYVGKSEYTDDMGITDKNLKYGAFRIVSGPNSLVLLGHDYDYSPPDLFLRWDKETEEYTNVRLDPKPAKNKRLSRGAGKGWWKAQRDPGSFDEFMTKRYGEENRSVWNPKNLKLEKGETYFDGVKKGYIPGFWKSDQGGSFNAVFAFLRNLGARWYMPAETEIGEVIPEHKTIALPDINKTDKPDSALRYWFWYNYSMFPFEHVMWARRLGINTPYELFGDIGAGHGLNQVLVSKELREQHPEYYALLGGSRDNRDKYGQACHSSEGLIKTCIKYARFMFDTYNAPHVSFFPPDGFKKCGCEKCKDKTPSELVWGFIDKIARELYKTHPDRIVSCGAYTSYAKPPKSINKFTPNVAVLVGKSQRPYMENPDWWKKYTTRVEEWRMKLAPQRLFRNENNRYTLNNIKPIKFPAMHPHGMAKDLSFLKGISLGEFNEQSQSRARWKAPGSDHLNLYVNARFLWDADQDIEKVLAEYFKKFYGPAAKVMQKAFMAAEKTYNELKLNPAQDLVQANVNELTASVNYLEGLHKALKIAGEDSIYGKRIAFILSEYVPFEKVKEELEIAKNAPDPRADAPLVIGVDADSKKKPQVYHLKDIHTGEKPELDTSFTVTWDKGNLIFDVRCEDNDMENLFVTDFIWDGDSVALLIETPFRSYYQIEVNPDGQMFDADRKVGVVQKWKSLAQVKTTKGDNFWTVKVTIPIMAPEENQGDPYHYVVGPKPSKDKLWYFNIGRVRKRNFKTTAQTFIPTIKGGYHVRDKFAKLAIE